ncbi:MAG: aminotransferase class IV family protein [Anaerolineae bacterium]|nr:aminotransferase class IV family protein [Anaerolineae bacterium]
MNTQTPILTAVLAPDGALTPTPYTAVSLADAAQQEPEGVYTVARTFNQTGALELRAHLDRLAESARLTGIERPPAQETLRAALRSLIQQAGYPETRFRITLPHDPALGVYFALEPLNPVPESVRASGVSVQTFPTRRQNPTAKATRWMEERAALVAQMRPDTYEGMLTGETGEILEGFGSNFYAIQSGTLHTAGAGVLNGISRRIVLAVAPAILPLSLNPVRLSDVSRLEEAFLTSSSRGVIPIVRIDDQTIGAGVPGPFTRQIAAAYDAWATQHIEPI